MRRFWSCIMVFVLLLFLGGCDIGKKQNNSEKEPQVTVLRAEFALEERGSSMTLYTCISENADNEVIGLNMDALSAVIDFTQIETRREFDECGYPCGIFQGENVSYACWTSCPEGSGILEYDPAVVSEEEVMKVIESVYKNPNT